MHRRDIRKTRLLLSILGLLVATASLPAHAIAQAAPPTANLAIPGAKERQAIRYDLISKRLDTVLLGAMRRNDIDAWLTFSREANLDPILSEIGGGWGGVRNAYIFFDRGDDKPEKVFIGSHQLRGPDHSRQLRRAHLLRLYARGYPPPPAPCHGGA